MLTREGLCPRDAVAFSAATQMVGVGVFAPLNWLVVDPKVFLPKVWLMTALPACLGLACSLLLLPIKRDEHVQDVYVAFCLAVAVYTSHGLSTGRFDRSDPAPSAVSSSAHPSTRASAREGLRDGAADWLLFGLAAVAGGWLTGYIGVSVEKVLFTVLTWRHAVDARAASVTSICVVGWVSAVAFVMHAAAPCNPAAPGYIGAVPYAHWLAVLPGLLVGSVLGPEINARVGPRRVLALFVLMLLLEVGSHAAGSALVPAARGRGGRAGHACRPLC